MSVKHSKNRRLFPLKPSTSQPFVRKKEAFQVNFATHRRLQEISNSWLPETTEQAFYRGLIEDLTVFYRAVNDNLKLLKPLLLISFKTKEHVSSSKTDEVWAFLGESHKFLIENLWKAKRKSLKRS